MLNKSNIEEANKHLQALYGKVQELECIVQDQHEALLSKDSFIQTKVAELSQQDDIIQKQKLKLEENELKINQRDDRLNYLELTLNEKESEIEILKKKNEALSKLMIIIPDMRTIMTKMEDIVASVDETEGNLCDLAESQTSAADGDTTDNDTKGGTDTVVKKIGLTQDLFGRGDGVFNEMAKNMSRHEGIKKFSISEDNEKEESGEQAKQKQPVDDKARSKEFYL